MPGWFYILRLTSNGIYCGSTKDKIRRFKKHFSGVGSRTTRLDPPVAVVLEEEFETYLQAYRREKQVKSWSRAKKEALINGDLIEFKRLSKSRKY
jgi:putative endonuclease